MNNIILFIVGWLICSVIGYGIQTAYWVGEYPAQSFKSHFVDALVFGLLFGPFSVIVGLFESGFCKHGFMLFPPKKDI